MLNLMYLLKKRKIRKWSREENIPELLNALANDTYDFKMLVVRVLGESRDKSVLPVLFKHLNDYTDEFRLEVEKAILKLDASLSTQQQIKILNDAYLKKNREKPKYVPAVEINKQLYSFKGRFNGNIQLTKRVKEMLKKPMRW